MKKPPERSLAVMNALSHIQALPKTNAVSAEAADATSEIAVNRSHGGWAAHGTRTRT